MKGHGCGLLDAHKRALFIDFINRSFRDVADLDYISARVCHRLDLKQQFLWASLQATEKYLKAILLYNDRSTKRLGHGIEKAYGRLEQITDIEFDIPKDVQEFIRYLNIQGPNRYFEYPSFTHGTELLLLDKTVCCAGTVSFFHGRLIPSPAGRWIGSKSN